MSLEFAALAVAFAFGLFVVYTAVVHHHEWSRWERTSLVEHIWRGKPIGTSYIYERHCKTCGAPQLKEIK